MILSLTTDQLINKINEIKSGDQILISGIIYTARDAAHKRLVELIREKKPLPVDLNNSIIYYCGPCPSKPGEAIGSCGPTTASRMDAFTPAMLEAGVKVIIGKGTRSKEVTEALKKYRALYCAVTGGIGALLSRKVKQSELVAFGDLGPEAIYRLNVIDFPLIAAIDSHGNNIYAPCY